MISGPKPHPFFKNSVIKDSVYGAFIKWC